MAKGRAVRVLFAAIFMGFLGALPGGLGCGTQLDIHPDTTGTPGADGGLDGDGAPSRATGGDCVFDDTAARFDDVCGFGP